MPNSVSGVFAFRVARIGDHALPARACQGG
jgi:hypothetical protein